MRLPPDLSGLERLVMEEVWRGPPATVRGVLDALNEDESREPRAYTTIMTILQRLEAKGMVTRTRPARADLYAPKVSREEHLAARADAEVAELVDRYGDHALAQFARHVDAIDEERLEALRRMAES